MKRFVIPSLLLFLVLTATFAQAKCYTRRLKFWPQAGTIQANAIFLIEGFAESQGMVKALDGACHAYLQAGEERVPLEVQEVLVGQYQLTQALLKPACQLKVGRQYEFIIAANGKAPQNLIGQHNGPMSPGVKYTVVADNDTAAPAWLTLPQEQAKHYEELGCGPEVFVHFAASVREQSAYLVKATVTDLASGNTTAYYLQPDTEGRIALGHGMCTGAFALEQGQHFAVTFALLDAAGNTTSWRGKAISFTRPDVPGLD